VSNGVGSYISTLTVSISITALKLLSKSAWHYELTLLILSTYNS